MSRSDPRRARGLATAALTLTLLTPTLLAWTWSRPQAAPPTELPALTLAPAEVRAVLDGEESLRCPDDEAAEARTRIYHEANLAEHDRGDYPGQARLRHERLVAALGVLSEAHGDDVIASIRARDLGLAMRALRGEMQGREAIAELGGFLAMMERYEMASGGRQTAPSFVVRTTLKARWNAMHDRDLTEGFSPIELRAYWGWLGLHANSAPLERRLEALEHYAQAGGTSANEARGVLRYRAGEADDAREAFTRAYEATGSFRLRNHALAAAE